MEKFLIPYIKNKFNPKHPFMIQNQLLIKLKTDFGPEESDFALIDDICVNHPQQLKLYRESNPKVLASSDSVIGHILHKPYGYAGDFKIIDRLYTFQASPNFPKWGKYSLQTHGAKAVRNRKQYFKTILDQLSKVNPNAHILNVASGPARDVYEYLTENPNSKFHFTCVDMDDRAIAYAKDLNKLHLSKVTFVKRNVLRFQSDDKFDLVWSAGLFDYFKDRIFVSLLTKFKGLLKPNGEVVVGNFNEDHNPSRNYMEVLGDWFLFHRSTSKLTQLGVEAGYKLNNLHIGREIENVNLFLHMRREGSTKAFYDNYNNLVGNRPYDLG